MTTLKEAVKRLSKDNTGFDAIIELATVKSVDELAMTCDVYLFDNDMLIEGVKLKPVVAELATDMGAVSFPEVKSNVLIGQINSNPGDLFVVCCSKVSKISLDAGSALKMLMDVQSGAMALDLASLIFNGGNNGGLPLIKPLIAKLNQIEKSFNDLLADFKAHKHTGGTISGLTGPHDKQSQGKIAEVTKLADLENTKIKM